MYKSLSETNSGCTEKCMTGHQIIPELMLFTVSVVTLKKKLLAVLKNPILIINKCLEMLQYQQCLLTSAEVLDLQHGTFSHFLQLLLFKF